MSSRVRLIRVHSERLVTGKKREFQASYYPGIRIKSYRVKEVLLLFYDYLKCIASKNRWSTLQAALLWILLWITPFSYLAAYT